jgi:hypothetical protein
VIPLPESISSYKEGNILSTLGLPLLTNEISESDEIVDSYGLCVGLAPLVNGDLSIEYHISIHML